MMSTQHKFRLAATIKEGQETETEREQGETDVRAPNMQHPKKIHRMAGVPIFSESVLNASAETMAPHLPIAAEIPCANARKRVGNISAG